MIENLKFKREICDIYYVISIECMEILSEKAKKYLDLKTKNSFSVSKSIYEESLNIGNYTFKDKIELNLIDNDLKLKYIKIKEDCEKYIKFLSFDYYNEIENTIKTGKLFSDSNLDPDILSLLSLNIYQILKTINSTQNFYQDTEALEKKSICLATIVKIEFSMKKRIVSLMNLLAYAEESINIVESKLGKEYMEKEWYNEIIGLRNQIQEKNISIVGTPYEGEEKIRENFEQIFLKGAEAFLKYLVENYPFKEFNKNYDIVGEYRKNKQNILKNLVIVYQNYDDNNTPLNNQGNYNDSSFKKDIILEYLSNLKNSLEV